MAPPWVEIDFGLRPESDMRFRPEVAAPESHFDLPPPWVEIDFGLRSELDMQFRPEVGAPESHFDLPPPWVEIDFGLRPELDMRFRPEVDAPESDFDLPPPWVEIDFGLGRNRARLKIPFRPASPLGRNRNRPGPIIPVAWEIDFDLPPPGPISFRPRPKRFRPQIPASGRGRRSPPPPPATRPQVPAAPHPDSFTPHQQTYSALRAGSSG
jgi:hypothetical protein